MMVLSKSDFYVLTCENTLSLMHVSIYSVCSYSMELTNYSLKNNQSKINYQHNVLSQTYTTGVNEHTTSLKVTYSTWFLDGKHRSDCSIGEEINLIYEI